MGVEQLFEYSLVIVIFCQGEHYRKREYRTSDSDLINSLPSQILQKLLIQNTDKLNVAPLNYFFLS